MENKSSLFKKLLIGFALIFLILFCISQKNAHALTQKGSAWDPDITNKERTYSWTNSYSNGEPHSWTQWFEYPLSSNWTINNDYDLVAFKFTRFNYALTAYDNYIDINGSQNMQSGTFWAQISDARPLDYEGVKITVTALYFTPNNTGVSCYQSSEVQDVFLCPISRGTVINRFAIIVNVTVPNQKTLYIDTVMERSKYFFNYDSTDIINYLEDSGIQQIITQQQQTNQALTGTDTTGASAGGLNDINSGASSLNTQLDSIVSVNNFSTIFTTFFTQIDNSTCTPLTLPFPFTNENIVLPCLGTEFQNRIPVIWALYTTIITGVIVLRFWRFYIDMFKHLLDPYSTGLHGVSDIAGGGK